MSQLRISHRGRIERGTDPDTIQGYLEEVLTGWRLVISGRKAPGGYEIEAVLAPVPDGWRIPEIDGEAPKE